MNVDYNKRKDTGGRMKRVANYLLILTIMIICPTIALAQVDGFGIMDTVYADLAKIDDQNWSITISVTNDEEIEGLSIPLKMTAGMVRIVADSAIYTGGRVEMFSYTGFRCDTAIQCVTLGMMANLGPTRKYLPRGSGRLVTIFVSSLNDQPIEKFSVDTTTTQPNNFLMIIANPYQYEEDHVDTIPLSERERKKILPAFVARYSE